MASPLSLPSLQGSLAHKTNFLAPNPISSSPSRNLRLIYLRTNAKFNISELLGGRGLCNGEKGVQEELKRETEPQTKIDAPAYEGSEPSVVEAVPEEGFDKELFGLTGGFPGGEKGLKKFVEKNPPPPKASVSGTEQKGVSIVSSLKKPKAPELPLLLPGMIVIVKNPKNPFHMYFRLEELERREKGPPMVNPQSAIFEEILQQEA